MTHEDQALARLSAAEQMLAECASAEDAVTVARMAEAARVFARQMKLGTSAANHATTIKLRATRRLAVFVDEGQANGTIATQARHPGSIPNGNTAPSTLDALGIKAKQVHEARLLAGHLTDAEITKRAGHANAAGRELSAREVLREARKAKRRQRNDSLPTPPPATELGVFPVLLADPPWRYEFAESSSREIENHYPTMTAQELADLDVPAADDAVLFMWATSPKLLEALNLMRAWKFEYRTSMVWVKDRIGMGYWARQQHEFVLIGRRGDAPPPDEARRPASVFKAPRGAHSEKPAVLHELIEGMYPSLSRVELFARAARDGWHTWGNQC